MYYTVAKDKLLYSIDMSVKNVSYYTTTKTEVLKSI